jgi:hypothetical protein
MTPPLASIFIACPTCLADNGGIAQNAANMGIWVMLAALGVVFLGIASVAYSFIRRQRRLSAQPLS